MAIKKNYTPTVQDIFDAVGASPSYKVVENWVSPHRYPNTYAIDFVRANIEALIPVDPTTDQDITVDRSDRGEVSRLMGDWADANNWDLEILMGNLADAYLIEDETELPFASKNRHLQEDGPAVQVAEPRRDASEAAVAAVLADLGLPTGDAKRIADAAVNALTT